MTLPSFPEELLERILAPCVLLPLSPTTPTPRPQWHRSSPSPSSSSSPMRTRLAPLLVSKTFLRICTPLFYHTLHLSSISQLQRLLGANPSLITHTRELILAPGTISAEAGELLSLCTALRYLEMSLDASSSNLGASGGYRDLDAEEFTRHLCSVIRTGRVGITHLVLRKATNVYLTQQRPRYVLMHLAEALEGNESLEHVELAFRISDDNHCTSGPGPITLLTKTLSALPRLHTFSTHLPSLWNEAILCVSANPVLERIVLADSTGGDAHVTTYGVTGGAYGITNGAYGTANNAHATPAVLGTGIFFSQARKHARLSELIRNGTAIVRTRAQTIPPLQMSPLPLLGVNTSNMLNTGLSSTGAGCNLPSGCNSFGSGSGSSPSGQGHDSTPGYNPSMGSSASRSGYCSAPTTPSDSRPCGSRIHHYQGREQQHVQWSRPLLPSPSSSSSSSHSPSSPSLPSPCSSLSNSHGSLSAAGRLTASTSWESFVSGTPPPRSPRCQLQ
ncbi:hypothetical protein K443DRAFT_680829 [Laccaria amethystina LaAM-08-1]|uniref:Uncharacterized protein n=1 Tax=Laccaria amethystina LaAM-08-1 TaxID=1095629 RepID=A0A0C9XAE6_9AGAR|nr:hypothetical protein K443DRAFT_680829 [Laccaria amethystina LaAM-08-1]